MTRKEAPDNTDGFSTGYGDASLTVEAMKAGAVVFLTKPVRDQQLLDAVQQATDRIAWCNTSVQG